MNHCYFFFSKRYRLICLIVLSTVTTLSFAESHFSSSVEQTQLIELYTSEGCSSCPPADRWLSRYKDHPSLWRHVIPVAFHVDYWDYIGWTDRFASAAFSHRQRQHKRQRNIRDVYTPGFVVDGNEWKGWFRGNRKPPASSQQPGKLSLTINGDVFQAGFEPVEDAVVATTLTVAILGFDLTTPVKAGENKGELLRHDFVVLALKDYSIDSNIAQWRGRLPVVAQHIEAGSPLAVAAWLNEQHSLKPIQAVAGWLQ